MASWDSSFVAHVFTFLSLPPTDFSMQVYSLSSGPSQIRRLGGKCLLLAEPSPWPCFSFKKIKTWQGSHESLADRNHGINRCLAVAVILEHAVSPGQR